MENWKKAVIIGSAGAAAVLLVKGKRPAGLLVAGVGLAVLATEYPRAFDQVANLTPGPLGRGLRFVEVVSRASQKLASAFERDHGPVDEYEA